MYHGVDFLWIVCQEHVQGVDVLCTSWQTTWPGLVFPLLCMPWPGVHHRGSTGVTSRVLSPAFPNDGGAFSCKNEDIKSAMSLGVGAYVSQHNPSVSPVAALAPNRILDDFFPCSVWARGSDIAGVHFPKGHV